MEATSFLSAVFSTGEITSSDAQVSISAIALSADAFADSAAALASDAALSALSALVNALPASDTAPSICSCFPAHSERFVRPDEPAPIMIFPFT